ncbi:aminoglycoside phosphotransferase family protein [Octadecabacter antarcticus]|nr:phosphotransferase [Octadecabacter antarcticus]
MTADASPRQYERLIGQNGRSVVLMDAPPETCGSQSRFVDIATHLKSLNLASPEVLEWDDPKGLMIISDLGQHDFAKYLSAAPTDEPNLYSAAVNVLRTVQSTPPPIGLTEMTPDVGADMVSVAFEWAATDQSKDLATEITASLRNLLQEIDHDARVLSLRDFHAENLIWRPTNHGNWRVGLLDFQDAFIAHPTYDLASLLRDARRDVDPAMLASLLTQLAGEDGNVADFKRAFHVMAVQRNLRILGIFHRLAQQDGKTGYLSLAPRVWAHLQTDLAMPDLADLGHLVQRALGPKGAQS